MVRTVVWMGCAVLVAVAACVLASGWAGSVAVPAGPVGMSLAIDAVSAVFFILVALAGAVDDDGLAPLRVGAASLAVVAADGFTLLVALGLLAMAARPGWVRAAPVLLVPAVALLAGPAFDLTFAAMRHGPPEGPVAAGVMLLTLGAAMPWLLRGEAMLGPIAGYVVVRVLLDLCGPAVPAWWGVLPVVLGAGAMLRGGWLANGADDLAAVMAGVRRSAMGVVAIGLGVAIAARGADVPPLAGLALGGALLHALCFGMADALLVLGAAAVARGAGTRSLSRLGGLVRSMPVVAGGLLVGAGSAAGLPLLAGFAGVWMVVQAVLAAPRIGGFGVQVGVAVVLAAVALGLGLAAAAALRLVGIGVLGRPRTPRASAAEDATGPARWAVVGLAGLCVGAGVWPAAALAVVQPALRQLLGGRFEGAGWLTLSVQADGPGYAALGIAALLAGFGAVAWWLRPGAVRRAPAWDGGRDPPPPWLPFGDPAAQYSAASAGRALRDGLDPQAGTWARAVLRRGRAELARRIAG